MRGPTKKLGPKGWATLTFIGYKRTDKQTNKQTDKQSIYIEISRVFKNEYSLFMSVAQKVKRRQDTNPS